MFNDFDYSNNTGIEMRSIPTRYGYDGTVLSQKVIPFPNLFTGAHYFPSIYEYLPVESLKAASAVVQENIKIIYSKFANCSEVVMNVMLFSNGKLPGDTSLLEYGKEWIRPMMEKTQPKKMLFIPFAMIRGQYSDRTQQLQQVFDEYDCEVVSIHEAEDPVQALKEVDGIIISGGNTWVLNRMLYDLGLVTPMRDAVINKGKLFIGWSAGTNVATPTIRTTNDMPIVSAAILPALNFVPFQINPHYIEASISGHMGETRDERIEEFLCMNPSEVVVGIPEGTMLQVCEGKLTYHTATGKPMKLFKHGQLAETFTADSDLAFLMDIGC